MREEGAETYATQNITERWAALIERIQDKLGQMAEGPLGKIINQFIDIISQTGFFEGVMKKVKVVIDSIAGFFADLPTRIQQMLRMAQTIFATIAAFQTAAAITLAFTPGGQAAAVGMGFGAAKMMAASYGAGMAAETVGEMAAKAKQTFSQPAGNSAGNQSNNNQNQQPVAVTVINKYDGQHAAVAVNTNMQSSAGLDNTGTTIMGPMNIGNSGQTTA
jgi:hypothetical protein